MSEALTLGYPAAMGGTITQAHADYCAAHGHATLTNDGAVAPFCPRCGDSLSPVEDVVPAPHADINLCTDCTCMAANDDDMGYPSVRENYYAGIADWREKFAGPVRVVITDGESFYRNPGRCGVCGSRWAGHYYSARVEAV